MHGIQNETLSLLGALNIPNTDVTAQTTNELNETSIEMEVATNAMSACSILSKDTTNTSGGGGGNGSGNSEYNDMMEEAIVNRLQFPIAAPKKQKTQDTLATVTTTTTTTTIAPKKGMFDHLWDTPPPPPPQQIKKKKSEVRG
jgi:hypothetical protein